MISHRQTQSHLGFHRFVFAIVLLLSACRDGEGPPVNFEKCGPLPSRPPSQLVIAGSGVNLPVFSRIVAMYKEQHDGRNISMPPSIGSSGAVKALADGAIHIGLASRPLRDFEKKFGIEQIEFARIPMVAAVHKDTKIGSLSVSELEAIYSGKRKTWDNGTNIVPIFREEGDSGLLLIEKALPSLHKVLQSQQRPPTGKFCYTEEAVIASLQRIPGAIGFTDMGTVNLLQVPVNTTLLYGGLSNGADMKRPIFRPLYIITRENSPKAVSEFIEFCFSQQVSRFMKNSGYALPQNGEN